MSAAEALKAARAAGIELAVDGDDLVLSAASAPPAAVLDALSRHKAEIVALLRPGRDGWSAEDWQVLLRRAGGHCRVRRWTAACGGRGTSLRMLRRRMAEPQSGLAPRRPLPRLRWQRAHLRPAAAIRHRTDRPCLAAFALLGSMARWPESQGGRRPITDPGGRLMGKRSNFERREADFYPTPRGAVLPLIPYLRARHPDLCRALCRRRRPGPAPGILRPALCLCRRHPQRPGCARARPLRRGRCDHHESALHPRR